jgi:hypothetical protein
LKNIVWVLTKSNRSGLGDNCELEIFIDVALDIKILFNIVNNMYTTHEWVQEGLMYTTEIISNEYVEYATLYITAHTLA